MSDTGGEWQVLRRRKGAAARRQNTTRPVSAAETRGEEPLDVGKTVKRIRETVSELRCEDFWKEWKDQLLLAGSTSLSQPPENSEDSEASVDPLEEGDGRLECVCYGLGSFSSCVSARFQLAMLLLLLDAAKIPAADCSVYDPVFCSGEKDVLRELGLTVLTENEEGKRPVTKPTLFYLMHCGKALYNNLLWSNWSPRRLPLVTIIGNSFNGMRDRSIDRVFRRDYAFVLQAADACEERPLPCPPRLVDVFADTAVISFPPSGLDKLPRSVWTEPAEPRYQNCPDLEITLREAQN